MVPAMEKKTTDYRKPWQIALVSAIVALTSLARLVFTPMTGDLRAVFFILFAAGSVGALYMGYLSVRERKKTD